MQILSHRGYWKDISEKNKAIAFERSFDLGFGTETDLRDICGKIVISHDMPNGNEMSFEDLLKIMNGRNLPLALNIKADGQAEKIKELLAKYNHSNYFCFDMSIPDMIVQLKSGLNVFSGMSEILPNAPMFEQSQGIWLDSFYDNWWKPELIENLLKQKKVCIVSADLHKRDSRYQWGIISEIKNLHDDNLMICTDYPEQAREHFYG